MLALNQEIVIQEYVEKDDNEPTDRRRETVNSQTLLALSSRHLCNRTSSTAMQDGNTFRYDIPNNEQRCQSDSDLLIESSAFVEIDLDNDEDSNTTLLTDADPSIEYTRNFECLNDLAETCI